MVPTTRALADDVGQRLAREAEQARSARGPTSSSPGATSSDRLAVEASVTNAPHRRCTSQLSVVVTTPSAGQVVADPRIFGARSPGRAPGRWSAALTWAEAGGRRQGFGPAVLPHDRWGRLGPSRDPRPARFRLDWPARRRRSERRPRRGPGARQKPPKPAGQWGPARPRRRPDSPDGAPPPRSARTVPVVDDDGLGA